ncbi:MAG: hypothetical protein M3Z54_03735 [Gemmatimonadota bacterium]|nr:hypothetical protein [Gemmatimonadota bacterium]
MLTRHSKLLLGLTAAPSVLFAACTDNTGVVAPDQYAAFAGTYQLTLFAGTPPPVTYTYQPGSTTLPNGGTVTWNDGTMVLRADGTFTEINNDTVISPTGGSPTSAPPFTSIGTFSVNGTTFALHANPQGNVGTRNATGTINATTISYQESNGTTLDTFEYKR